MKNINIRPYFDDYDENKQFYQILFRPSYAIQARELNQLQTILQQQIARHGSHIFKEGAMVVPGQMSIDTALSYVKLDSTYNGTSIDSYVGNFIGETVDIVGMTSGITAKAIISKQSSSSNPTTIWVKYISSGANGNVKTFTPGEIIRTTDSNPLYATVKSTEDAIGVGSSANIQKGVYYVNSRFVLVKEQTIILDDYSNLPSYRIGLQIEEDFISPETDDSLFDNAQGSSNVTAPGAHRYYIDLKLSKFSNTDSSDKDFIELLRVTNGVVESNVVNTEYSAIADALARRTYDESGNYTIDTFQVHSKEHRNNDRGEWTSNTKYTIGDIVKKSNITYVADSSGTSGVSAPTHTIGNASDGSVIFRVVSNPSYNQGVYSPENGGDLNSIALTIDPGKAYVYGYEINKIGQSVVKLPKATTFDSIRNATIQTQIGSYVIVDNVFGSLDTTQFPIVELRDGYTTTPGVAAGNIIGVARARYVEYNSGTIGTATCQYVLSLFDIKMSNGKKFESNVRQIHFSNSTGAHFTSDTNRNTNVLSGSVSTTSGSAIVNGIGTIFTQELSVGDTIGVYSAGVFKYGLIVQSISSDTLLNLTSNATFTVANTSAYSVSTTHFNKINDSLVFPLPTKYTRKVKDIDDDSRTNISYYVRQSYSAIVATGGTTVSISTSTANETFASPQQPDAFHVVDATSGNVISASIALNGASNLATITLGAGFVGHTISIIATVKKTAKERTKTIVRAHSEDVITTDNATAQTISLSKVDGIELLKVYEYVDNSGNPVTFGASIPSNAIPVDITSRYIFSNGKTPSHYGLINIRNTTSIQPRSPIRVIYDYHEHSSTGDYFSIDSYDKTIQENDTDSSGKSIDLFDCIDFRPTKTTSGFVGSSIPAIGFDIIADYTYFLPRVDKISLSSMGDFISTQGAPAVTPLPPSTPDSSMLMYTVSVYPSIIGTPYIYISREDNRRYTMRDVGSIDRRLSNVEYYTSLNLLESQTKNLQLFDKYGNLSFKNGFIVDSLVDQTIGDTLSDEFRCSIGIDDGTLHPSFSVQNVKLFEKNSTTSDRLQSGYVVNDNIVTLPFTSLPTIKQTYASRSESVTPFIKANFVGDIKLTPSSDEWFETKYKPDIVTSQEGNFTAVSEKYSESLGTIWNQWQTSWTGQSTINVRSGTTTYVKAVYDTTVISDRIVSIDIIPFIRSRSIAFFGTGMKPNTRVYAYFDSTPVSNFVTTPTRLSFSSKTTEFDTITFAGGDSDNVARSIASKNNAVSTALSMGDIVHNGAGGNIALATASGVAVMDEDLSVQIVNVRGNFIVGQTIYGSISGAVAVITSISVLPYPITNSYGEVAGLFDIPSTPQMAFRTGTKNFTLTDSITNTENYTTKATSLYTAVGYTNNRQRTIVSTRNGVIAQEAASQRVVTVVSRRADPLAQSFTTPEGKGIFIESVDLYFAGKDRTLPLIFEIREMENGYPTHAVVPGSRLTVKPNKISISANASVSTKLKMSYPIYLDGDTEYCFVLASDSPYYSVWVSYMGENDITTGQRIAKQPYLGSLFKSQNSSTWDADQMEDIKFTINRCVFDTSVAANIKFKNQRIDSVQLKNSDIFTKSGSNKVRIMIPNHGVPVGSKIVISGAVSPINGISASNINGSRTVASVEQDSLVIVLATNATMTGNSQIVDPIYVTRHVKFDMVNLSASQIQLDDTSINHYMRCIDTAYVMQNDAIEIVPQENTKLSTTRMIASNNNESEFNGSASSIEVVTQMQSINDSVSPVIDLNRHSIICVGNRIDTNHTTKNITNLDDIAISINVTFSTNSTITSTALGGFSNVKVGQIINVSGATNAANNGTSTVLSIDSTNSVLTIDDTSMVSETSTVTLTVFNRYFSEISENGTSVAKYIMKPLLLDIPASSLRVYFDVNSTALSDFKLFYRTGVGSNKLNGVTWKEVTPLNKIVYSNSNEYSSVEYLIQDTGDFSSAQLKIVMLSDNSAYVPTFKQIRLIATS